MADIKSKDEFEEFMRDVPRGVDTRDYKRHKAPNARWARPAGIIKEKALSYDPHNPGKKILIGAIGDHLIGIEDNRHIMTVAGSRAGKSVGLTSNLYFYRGSILATDPKGELAEKTAERREKMGQKVYILDPFSYCSEKLRKYRASYNPMSILDIENSNFLENATLIAESLVVQTKDQKDPHWDESAKNFIEGVIAHVATAQEHKEQRHLITVRQLIITALESAKDDDDENAIPALAGEMMENANYLEKKPETLDIGIAISGAAIDFYSKGGNERASVYSTVLRHTKFLDYPAFKDVLKEHDFDLSELKTNPKGVSVYLCFPATKITIANRWMRLFVNQLLEAMEREKTVPEIPVLACLDEFPVLGYMKQLETATGLIASFGVRLWIVLQDWSQGKALYGERWESFSGNAGIMQFFGNNDVTTTEYISRKLDKAQVTMIQQNEVTQDQREKGISGKSESIQHFDLLTPSEVSLIFSRDDPLKRQLILWAGKHPMIIQRVEYYGDDTPLKKYL